MKKFIDGIPGGYNSTEPDYSGYKQIEPDYAPAQGIVRQAQDCVIAAYRKGYCQGNADREHMTAEEYERGFNEGRINGMKDAWRALKYLVVEEHEGGWSTTKIRNVFAGANPTPEYLFQNYIGPDIVEMILQHERDKEGDKNKVYFDDYNHTICPHCNKQIDVDSDCGFCPKCGGTIKWPD